LPIVYFHYTNGRPFTNASMTERIRRQPSLAQQTYAALVEDIASGVLTSGERILIERLAERLGVSPTPVREAIACLVQEGMVDKLPDGKLHIASLSHAYVLDVFLVRSALEGLATELATTRVSEHDLQRLAVAFEQATTSLQRVDFGPYVAADALLHGTIIAAAGSVTLTRELVTLQTHIAYVRGYAHRHGGDHMHRSHHEHQAVLAALMQRAPERARHAMEHHIRQSGARIAELIEREGGLWEGA
jgi:DNA-binding GntR family transcriptional regulator